jgi:hypothetical protein
MRLFAGLLVLLASAAAAADDAPPPKYPPGFDCSAVPAGSQRQACNRSHLDPPMGSIDVPKRVQPDGLVPSVNPQPLPTAKPPTIPRLPGTIQNGN